MSNPDQLPHANHNERVCDFLLEQSEGEQIGENYHHNDWIITTAFYSALHYVQSVIFPITKNHPVTDEIITINCFSVYYGIFRDEIKINKHDATARLVEEYRPLIGDAYRHLMDACKTARYNNYNVKLDYARFARKKLLRIKEGCLAPSDSGKEAKQ
jgi:hypothetical protein